MKDPLINFFANLAAALFFMLIAVFVIWLVYAQSEAYKLKEPTCAEAVRVCVTSNGSECQHINSYCETRSPHTALDRFNEVQGTGEVR